MTDASAQTAETPANALVPAVSGGLLVDGTVRTHTSVKGPADAILHPLVDSFLRGLPVEDREMFRFNCAEAVLVSDALAELQERAGGEPLTWEQAVEHCSGGSYFGTLVRERFDPEHGAAAAPCKSCRRLLAELGIGVLES